MHSHNSSTLLKPMKTTTTTILTSREMARTSQDLASSKRHHFPWTNPTSTNKVRTDDDDGGPTSHAGPPPDPPLSMSNTTKKPRSAAVSRIRAAFLSALFLRKNMAAGFVPSRSPHLPLLGSGCRRAVGTLFGRRRGNVQFALHREAASRPSFFVELSTPIGSLVREMSSGLVRISLECDKGNNGSSGSSRVRLLEEPTWRAYCNGRKCGIAVRKECREKELGILKAIEPISMGAGVLPRAEVDGEGELMYVRGKFERIVGSRDCEAYYMMNPDCNGAPELSIYLLRV